MIILGASSEMRGARREAGVPERTMIESAIPCQPTNGSVQVLRQVAPEGHMPVSARWAAPFPETPHGFTRTANSNTMHSVSGHCQRSSGHQVGVCCPPRCRETRQPPLPGIAPSCGSLREGHDRDVRLRGSAVGAPGELPLSFLGR